MARFGKHLDDLLKLIMAQATLLLVASSLAVPAQKSIDPPSACLADYSMFVRTSLLRYYVVTCLFISSTLAISLKVHVKTAGGLASLSARRQKAARAVMMLSVVFSGTASALAIAAYTYFQQSTTVLFACMPAADRLAIYCSYIALTVLGIAFPTYAFLQAAYSSEL